MQPDEKAVGVWRWFLKISGISSLFSVSFGWPYRITLAAFAAMFGPAILIGGPGAHQSPMLAFILLPFVYIVARFLIWLWPRSAKWLFAAVLAGGIL